MTTEEKINEVQTRFDGNLTSAKEIEVQINSLQQQLQQLQQPLIEDQGALKTLKELIE